MTTNDTCNLTLSFSQANLIRWALLNHSNLIENDERTSADKKVAALADIDEAITQLNRYICAVNR